MAQPAYQSANFAGRLAKYATELGLTVALEHESSVIGPDGKPSARRGAVQLRLEQLEKDWDGGAGEIALKSHPTQVVDAIERKKREYQGCQVLKEWEDEAFENEWDMWDDEEEVEWTDDFRVDFRNRFRDFEWTSTDETQPGPAWAPNREEPVVLSLKPRHKRMMRELAKPRDGYSGSARTVVEVWRRQRRRGEQSEYNHLWWRMDYQQLRALEESSGLTPRRPHATYPDRFFPTDMPTQSQCCSTTWCSSSSTHTRSAAAGATAAATLPPTSGSDTKILVAGRSARAAAAVPL